MGMKKGSIKIEGKALHESRLNNTMLSSSRSTRTRKNIKPSSVSNDALMSNFGGGQGMNDDDEEDEDYRMEDDKNYLDEDDEKDDEHYEKITEPMDVEMDGENERKKKKKKHSKEENDEDDDMLIDSDED